MSKIDLTLRTRYLLWWACWVQKLCSYGRNDRDPLSDQRWLLEPSVKPGTKEYHMEYNKGELPYPVLICNTCTFSSTLQTRVTVKIWQRANSRSLSSTLSEQTPAVENSWVKTINSEQGTRGHWMHTSLTSHVCSSIDILKQKPTEPELKTYAVNLMNATNTFDYCRQRMAYFEEKARAEVKRLGGNVRLEKIIDLLSIPDPQADATKDVIPMFMTNPWINRVNIRMRNQIDAKSTRDSQFLLLILYSSAPPSHIISQALTSMICI